MAVGSWTKGETVRGTWARSGWASGWMLEEDELWWIVLTVVRHFDQDHIFWDM